MKIDKNVSLRLQNVGYHLALVSKNLNEALELLGVKSDAKAATEAPAKGKGKGKAAPAEEEMEEVESQFSDDPADFEDEPEEKPAKGKGKGKGKAAPVEEEESNDDDNFDFEEAEVEEEPEVTEADVRSAMTAYAKKHSKDKALAVLGKFAKSKKVTDVPPAKFQALIDALKVK